MVRVPSGLLCLTLGLGPGVAQVFLYQANGWGSLGGRLSANNRSLGRFQMGKGV